MFAIGTDVLVRALKRRGVVAEVVRAGVYRVQVGALSVTAREDELDAPPPSKKKKRQAIPPVGNEHERRSADAVFEPSSIDLHGLTVDEARNRVAGYISRAILAGLERVEIIHGIGSGRLKAAITKDLKALPVVRGVKPHPTNPGITLAYL